MKSTPLLLMALLLPSCALNASLNASNASANRSALYDPPTVTLAPGTVYPFEEGALTGAGQKFHSDYTYREAIIIGNSNK